MMLDFVTASLNALPWFVMLFPLVQSLLAIVCITPYREQVPPDGPPSSTAPFQFFFLVTCGRCYHDKRANNLYESKKLGSEWTLGGSRPSSSPG